ncbi:MAG: tetratricopeptide repeat protein [Rhodospirillales bacterium]
MRERTRIFTAFAAGATLFLVLALAAAPASAADLERYNPRELREAAKGGDANAQYHLGRMHLQGYGVTKSVEAAVKWWRAAAEQGHAGAQYELGVLYAEGAEGVPKDSAEAVKWFRAAAEQGHEEALNALRAAAQERTERGIAAQELSELRLAAENGDVDAQFALGAVYYKARAFLRITPKPPNGAASPPNRETPGRTPDPLTSSATPKNTLKQPRAPRRRRTAMRPE